MLHRNSAQMDAIWHSKLIQHSVDAIVSIGIDSRVLLWNPAAERMFGFSEEEALGQEITQLIIPEEFRPYHTAGMKKLLSTGEGPLLNQTTEVVAMHKQGYQVPVELSLFESSVGETKEFTAIVRDITERKTLERDVAQRHEELSSLFQVQAYQLSFAKQRENLAREITEKIRTETDLDTILQLTVNQMGELAEADRCYIWLYNEKTGRLEPPLQEFRRYERMLPLSLTSYPDRVLFSDRLGVHKIVNIPDVGLLENISPEDALTIEEREIKSILHVPIRFKEKLLGILRIHTIRPHNWSEDAISLVESVANQIAIALYQARTLKEVQDSERKFKAIFDNALHMISIHDDEGRYIDVNPAIEEFLKLPMDVIIGSMPDDLYELPGQDFQEAWRRFLENGTARGEFLLKRQNGDIVSMECIAVANVLPGGHMVIAHDVTEAKHYRQRLEQYAYMLKRSNEELENFATIASHDLQNPIRKIMLFAEQLDTAGFSEDNLQAVSRIYSSAMKMQQLITDLLMLSRINRKGQPFQQVDTRELLEELLVDLELEIRQENAVVTLADLPTIEGDRTQLRQMFQNLISNALKFHKEGKAPNIQIYAEADGPQSYRFYVKDNGIGFDERYLDRIFIIFERLHHEVAYQGTGVGLAICQKIAERHHGNITAKSRAGSGATFIITLPVHQEAL